jgi:hypothetical protein
MGKDRQPRTACNHELLVKKKKKKKKKKRQTKITSGKGV